MPDHLLLDPQMSPPPPPPLAGGYSHDITTPNDRAPHPPLATATAEPPRQGRPHIATATAQTTHDAQLFTVYRNKRDGLDRTRSRDHATALSSCKKKYSEYVRFPPVKVGQCVRKPWLAGVEHEPRTKDQTLQSYLPPLRMPDYVSPSWCRIRVLHRATFFMSFQP